jgi:hypothetical protein
MLVNHRYVNSPSKNAGLWRYMDLAKLLAMLESSQLYFSRADCFEDPYEGEWPMATARKFKELKNLNALQIPQKLKTQAFVSCWCASQHESAALWKLYMSGPDGVAVRSDVTRLMAQLEQASPKVTLAEVGYIDYASETQIPWTEGLLPLLTRKRKSFAHEQEVRAIILSPQEEDGIMGVSVPVSLPDLLQSVHVSPTAASWFGKLVERLVDRYELGVPVVRSNLYDRPVY